ncbi:MAG: adenylate/guanylate cyclase domain-containing protein [Pseudohongiellaceae bacterium]
MFAFGSFQSRLSFFLLCLLAPVLGGIFYYVNSNNTEYTEETINSYLELGADVFDFTRAQQAETLQAITNSLTWDFGFRTAFASRDPGTLFDAALNVLDRSLDSADMLMIVDMNNEVIIDTQLQGVDELKGEWEQLIENADANEFGFAEAIIAVDGDPFQLIALPLYLPRQVAWIVGGFALDQAFVDRVKETIISEVSIIRRDSESSLSVVASTLGSTMQATLAEKLIVDQAALDGLQRITFEDEEYTTLIRNLFGAQDEDVQVVAVIQRSYDENNENVVQFRTLLIEFYGAVILISLVAVVLLARSVTNPLEKLALAVQKIEEGDYNKPVVVTSKDEIGDLANSVNSMAQGLAEKEKVRDLLGKVVSQEIAEQLLNNPVELGGEEKVVTILFSDIRGFTSFCEGLRPQKVLEELNHVLSTISNIIERNNGVVDKFQGDAVMALFGAPIQSDNDASNAMKAALEIMEALSKLDSRLAACIGVNTGLVVAGNLGSSNRLNYSVIGDTVNLSARLESLTRLYGVSNIVSEASMLAAPQFSYMELDTVCVAGKSQAVRIFELLGPLGCVTESQLEMCKGFESALQAYRSQDWTLAERLFSHLRSSCDNKQLPLVFLERIHQFSERPPGSDWDGVYVFGKK